MCKTEKMSKCRGCSEEIKIVAGTIHKWMRLDPATGLRHHCRDVIKPPRADDRLTKEMIARQRALK